MRTRCPISGVLTELSLTTYVDDVRRTTLSSSGTVEEAIRIKRGVDDLFTQCIAEYGLSENKGKEQIVPHFHGPWGQHHLRGLVQTPHLYDSCPLLGP